MTGADKNIQIARIRCVKSFPNQLMINIGNQIAKPVDTDDLSFDFSVF